MKIFLLALIFPFFFLWSTLRGFYLYHCMPRKTIVIIASAMRSGSTLLKALLAKGPDTSHLPEIPYHRYAINRYFFYDRMYRLSPKKIIILKRPLGFGFGSRLSYPCLPPIPACVIVLVRSPLYAIQSMVKLMNELPADSPHRRSLTRDEWVDYWCRTYEKTIQNRRLTVRNTRFLWYEDLLAEPTRITKELFAFIGSQQKEGVDTYERPQNYDWEFGRDDNSQKLSSLQVRKPTEMDKSIDQDLETYIHRSPKISAMLEKIKKMENFI